MKNLNQRYAEIVRSCYEENVKSGQAAVEYMTHSTAVYKGVPVDCLYIPKLFSQEAWDFLQNAAGTICSILDKVIARYLSDSAYRKLFPFPKELEDLILIEAGYPRLLPISRLDIFFNEDDFSFQFCEFNADGSSAMNEDREINNAVKQSDAFLQMQKDYKLSSFELFDSWVREFADIYAGYEKKVKSPRIVITDFMDKATPNEFIEFQKAFKKAGYDTEICEIPDLIYENGALKTPDGKKVDAVYRRAVTRDIMEYQDAVSPFIQAAKDGAVCIIGMFRTQVIHNKAIFRILRQEETLSFLTEAERAYILRHVPETLPLESGAFDMQDVLTNKDAWIIKPEDLYASKGVYAGVDTTAEDWKKAVEAATDDNYLLQRYCTPYQTENLDFNKSPRPEFTVFNNITGMFVYNDKLIGLYSRAGRKGTISALHEGRTMASVMAWPI